MNIVPTFVKLRSIYQVKVTPCAEAKTLEIGQETLYKYKATF